MERNTELMPSGPFENETREHEAFSLNFFVALNYCLKHLDRLYLSHNGEIPLLMNCLSKWLKLLFFQLSQASFGNTAFLPRRIFRLSGGSVGASATITKRWWANCCMCTLPCFPLQLVVPLFPMIMHQGSTRPLPPHTHLQCKTTCCRPVSEAFQNTQRQERPTSCRKEILASCLLGNWNI